MKLSRRYILGAGLAAPAILRRPSWAAEFTLKYGNNMPASHPVSMRAKEAAEKIKQATDGRVEFLVFPNNQLGDDLNMLSQLRSGALQFQTISGGPLGTRVPGTTIFNTAFAFQNYDQVWDAMDGGLGNLLRDKIRKAGFHVLDKVWDNGFRQITMGSKPIRTPEDLKGVKFRVGPGKIYASLFETLGAAATTIVFSEVYTSLQTKLVDGQENGLVLIDAAKLYEVQKYCSLTNHMWDCYFMISNKAAWDKLPGPMQTVVSTEIEKAAVGQRADMVSMDKKLQAELEGKGMVFNKPDAEPFKAALRKSSFYKDWRETYGQEAWQLLEKSAGTLG